MQFTDIFNSTLSSEKHYLKLWEIYSINIWFKIPLNMHAFIGIMQYGSSSQNIPSSLKNAPWSSGIGHTCKVWSQPPDLGIGSWKGVSTQTKLWFSLSDIPSPRNMKYALKNNQWVYLWTQWSVQCLRCGLKIDLKDCLKRKEKNNADIQRKDKARSMQQVRCPRILSVPNSNAWCLSTVASYRCHPCILYNFLFCPGNCSSCIPLCVRWP